MGFAGPSVATRRTSYGQAVAARRLVGSHPAPLPPPKPRRARYLGRRRIDDRRALVGILFVLKTGIPWEAPPQEMG